MLFRSHAFREGEVWWLDAAEEEMISGEREQYQREETWETIVAAWIAERTPDQICNVDGRSALTAARLLREALDIDANQHTTGNITRIGQVMARLGYLKSRPTLDGVRTWVYSKSKAE